MFLSSSSDSESDELERDEHDAGCDLDHGLQLKGVPLTLGPGDGEIETGEDGSEQFRRQGGDPRQEPADCRHHTFPPPAAPPDPPFTSPTKAGPPPVTVLPPQNLTPDPGGTTSPHYPRSSSKTETPNSGGGELRGGVVVRPHHDRDCRTGTRPIKVRAGEESRAHQGPVGATPDEATVDPADLPVGMAATGPRDQEMEPDPSFPHHSSLVLILGTCKLYFFSFVKKFGFPDSLPGNLPQLHSSNLY